MRDEAHSCSVLNDPRMLPNLGYCKFQIWKTAEFGGSKAKKLLHGERLL